MWLRFQLRQERFHFRFSTRNALPDDFPITPLASVVRQIQAGEPSDYVVDELVRQLTFRVGH
jgi:hypothetical protein